MNPTSKPWWESRTIWCIAVALGAFLVQRIWGVKIPQGDLKDLVDTITFLLQSGALAGAAASRGMAQGPLTLTKAKP